MTLKFGSNYFLFEMEKFNVMFSEKMMENMTGEINSFHFIQMFANLFNFFFFLNLFYLSII
jgi:hypothetical protein